MSDHKRGFLVIISQILYSLMSGPMKKTHISYHAKLDSRLTNTYLSYMKTSGLIKNFSDPVFFEITPKGIKFLKTFQKMEELLKIENKTDLVNYA